MSKIEKRVAIYCNGDFVYILGSIGCSILGDHPESVVKDISVSSDNKKLGNALLLCLDNSKDLTNEEWDTAYGTDDQAFIESMKVKSAERDSNLIKKYRYKDKNALYKNMHSCSIFHHGDKTEIWPEKRSKGKGIDSYERFQNDGIEDIYVNPSIPPELLGACVRFAFIRCKGKGIDVVTKSLFLDGTPNSLKEYLESIDKDYKKWLITE
jgi:hypothetical protein